MNTLLDVPVAERPTAVMAYNDMMALGAMSHPFAQDARAR